ncbi:MAG: glycosyltransferase family 1 protein [Bradyrhizobium sp.]|uniref:glycosyltransferase family 4 protein n=1 Tax=Bradyrhizobium sp. TaxID=376 RepID=UPI001206710A|nr:glycosyltransferase family 4 protein [Bradyrhizobium sp.]THD64006.1 MAG: glycosyltransferase family 1 protein [Bradyrhizobium sp.]
MTGDAPQRRHIIFVGGSSEPGGLHIHTAEVAQACAALGHRVTILCPSINYFDGLICDPRVIVACIPPLGEGRWHERVLGWLRVIPLHPRPDIVFCRGSFAETQIVDLATAAGLARRLFTIEHRPWENAWRRRMSKTQYGRLSGLLLHRSICVSDEIKTSAINEFRFPARKISTCLNWVHPGFTPPTAQQRRDARAELAIASSTLLIGYVGRLAPEKRIDVLLEAFAMLAGRPTPQVELVIVGDGWKRQPLTQLACDLGTKDRVRFLGWSTMPSTILGACDLFVLPSLVEGFPLALMEAMASGCPCMAHPMSSTTRLIESGKTGMLVDMHSAEGLAAGLAELIGKGPERLQQMGAAAATLIAAEFSRQRRLPDILDALEVEAPALPQPGPRLLAFNRG